MNKFLGGVVIGFGLGIYLIDSPDPRIDQKLDAFINWAKLKLENY